jgi:hypothetical protein
VRIIIGRGLWVTLPYDASQLDHSHMPFRLRDAFVVPSGNIRSYFLDRRRPTRGLAARESCIRTERHMWVNDKGASDNGPLLSSLLSGMQGST